MLQSGGHKESNTTEQLKNNSSSHQVATADHSLTVAKGLPNSMKL